MGGSAPSLSGILFALGSAIGYGVNIVSAREAALAGIAGAGIIFWRVILMFAAIVAVVVWRQAPLAAPAQERRTLALLTAVSAVMGVAYLSAVGFIPVTLAVVIFYTYPVMIILVSPLVTDEGLTTARLGVAALAFAGLIAVIGPAFDGLDWRGVGLALIAAICTTAQFFAAARCVRTPLLTKLFWMHVGMAPFALAVCLTITGLPGIELLERAPWAVAVTVVGYMVGVTLQMAALGRIGAALGGLIFCLEPVVSALGSILYLGERLATTQVIGGVAVIAAIVASVATAPKVAR